MSDIPKHTLVNIRDVAIDTSLPGPLRVEYYRKQIGDPCHFRYDDTPVHLVFTNDGRKLSEALAEYFHTRM